MIDFLAFFLLGASLALGSIMLWGHDAQTITAHNAHNHCTKHKRRMIERAHSQENTSTWQAQQRDKEGWETDTLYLLTPTYFTASPNKHAWLCCACRVYSALFGFSFSASMSTFYYFSKTCKTEHAHKENGLYLLFSKPTQC